MKNGVILGFLLFVAQWACAQSENGPEKLLKSVEETEIGCIIWPAELPKSVPMVFDADDYYRRQIDQPWEEVHCFSGIPLTKNGIDFERFKPGPLNEDLPLVHTLTGSIFTFDYLRPSVR